MTDPEKHGLAARMAELARSVASPRSIDDVLSGVTAGRLTNRIVEYDTVHF